MQYKENLNCTQLKRVTFRGGYDQKYTTSSDYTVLSGQMTIKQGIAVLDKIYIE